MADREQRHINADVLHAIKEEDNPEQEQQVIVSGNHVLRTEVNEGEEEHPAAFLYVRSEEHTSELQSLMRISYAVFCLKKKKKTHNETHKTSLILNKNNHKKHNGTEHT